MNINDTITDGTARFVVRSIGFLDLLDALHPIGDIYITVKEGTPFAKFGFGEWKLVGQNKCLWGGGANSVAGTEIEAGLPNITGTFGTTVVPHHSTYASGCFRGATIVDESNDTSKGISNPDDKRIYGYSFNASLASSVYGKSTTVQPPAYVVYIWQRIA